MIIDCDAHLATLNCFDRLSDRDWRETYINNNYYDKACININNYDMNTYLINNFHQKRYIDNNIYTKTQSDSNYYTKAQSDDQINDINRDIYTINTNLETMV
jgi:hypothetical protein